MSDISIIIALDEKMYDCEGRVVDVEKNHFQTRPICEVLSINAVPAKWLTREALIEARSQLELSDQARYEVEYLEGHDGD